MKKHHHLSLIAALVLSACGGGSDGSNSDNGGNGAPADITLSGRALSSDYLVGRTVCLDLNANQQWLITSCRSANNIMPITIFLPAGTASFFYSA
ncbi:hypothetical protein [Aeromonas allosaccharophila]|uniref:Lipoprotein n=1 Tax=Aeromonas allosaccharophila TaxID=656 RepID=A0AAX3NPX5_9GAMM|nr:hypothetical protein [Aeromonas allosaccharophila]WED75432.1 hypothetical protein PYU98_16025 [Aeromonas allosaccharophila]